MQLSPDPKEDKLVKRALKGAGAIFGTGVLAAVIAGHFVKQDDIHELCIGMKNGDDLQPIMDGQLSKTFTSPQDILFETHSRTLDHVVNACTESSVDVTRECVAKSFKETFVHPEIAKDIHVGVSASALFAQLEAETDECNP